MWRLVCREEMKINFGLWCGNAGNYSVFLRRAQCCVKLAIQHLLPIEFILNLAFSALLGSLRVVHVKFQRPC
jgi:hypothetical protein